MADQKIDGREALKAVIALRNLIAGKYKTIHLAGSLRRGMHRNDGKPPETVGDVDVVVIPEVREVVPDHQPTLGALTLSAPAPAARAINEVWEVLDKLRADPGRPYGPYVATGEDGKPYTRWGEKYRKVSVPAASGLLPVELYMAYADFFGATLAIRTGPVAFSRALVNCRSDVKFGSFAHERGWSNKVRKKDEQGSWRRAPCPTEESLFELLRLPYLAPHQREGVGLASRPHERPVYQCDGVRFRSLVEACEFRLDHPNGLEVAA